MNKPFLPFLLALLAGAARAQAPDLPLEIAITGSRVMRPTAPREEDPFEALLKPQVQALLLRLAAAGPSTPEVASLLQGSGTTVDHLVKAGLLRQREGRLHLAFSLLTRADQALLLRVIEPFAGSLAEALLEERRALEASLQRSPQARLIGTRGLAFLVVGCAGLDWDGLSFISCKGYRATPPTTPFGRYLLWAIETAPSAPAARLYDQSTSQSTGSATFTTFGAFPAPGERRAAFPDLQRELWEGLDPRALGPEKTRVLRRALQGPTDAYFQKLAALMLELRTPKSRAELTTSCSSLDLDLPAALQLLTALGYLRRDGAEGNYMALVPVLGMEDQPWIQEVRTRTWSVLERWCSAHYANLERACAGLSASRHGVPFSVTFDQVYHYLFGRANARLIQAEFYPDVEAKAWPHPGFIPSA